MSEQPEQPKPCPFCGDAMRLVERTDLQGVHVGHTLDFSGDCPLDEKVFPLSKWNTRVLSPTSDAPTYVVNCHKCGAKVELFPEMEMTASDAQLAEFSRLHGETTQGEWSIENGFAWTGSDYAFDPQEPTQQAIDQAKRNEAFAVAAHNAFPSLLARLRPVELGDPQIEAIRARLTTARYWSGITSTTTAVAPSLDDIDALLTALVETRREIEDLRRGQQYADNALWAAERAWKAKIEELNEARAALVETRAENVRLKEWVDTANIRNAEDQDYDSEQRAKLAAALVQAEAEKERLRDGINLTLECPNGMCNHCIDMLAALVSEPALTAEGKELHAT